MYHVGALFPFIINFLWSVYRLFSAGFSGETIVGFLLSIALLLMFFSVRVQILTVQDRVVRLEMRLRLRELLPADLQAAGSSLTVPQLIALRFASDAEMPGLVRAVVSGQVSTPKDIKMRVKE